MDILLGLLSTGITIKVQILIAVIALVVIFLSITKKKVLIPKTKSFYILLVFSVVYAIFNYKLKGDFPYSILIGLPLGYYLGCYIEKYCLKNEKNIEKIILAISIGMCVHGLLNLLINLNASSRNTLDFWTRNISSATIQSTFFTLQFSLIFYVLKFEDKIWKKIVYIIFTLLSLYYITILASRTPLIVLLIVLFITVIYYFWLNRNNLNKKDIKKILIGLCILFIVGIFIIIAYNINLLNIKESNLFSRIGQQSTKDSDSSRINNQIIGIKSIFENPFGNKDKVGDLRFAHNMWLDIGKDAGVIAFILIVVYSIYTFIYLLKLLKNKEEPISRKILLASVYLGMNIHCAVEPILQGNMNFFLTLVIINGIIDSYSKNKSN